MSFIQTDSGTRQLMQFAETGSIAGSQCLEELNRRRNDNGCLPQCREVARIQAFEIRLMMMLGNDLLGILSLKTERLAVNLDRLANDIGVRKNNNDVPQVPCGSHIEQMSHQRRSLA